MKNKKRFNLSKWNRVFAILILVLATGCATTNRTKTLMFMGAAGMVGGVIGGSTAPASEYPGAHAALWGGASAAVAGALGLFLFDEEKRANESERQNAVLKSEVDSFRGEVAISGGSSQEVRINGNPKFQKDVPEELRPFVKPGQWKYSRIPSGRWYIQGDTQMSRQCLETFQMNPPGLKPNISEDNSTSTLYLTPSKVNSGDLSLESVSLNQNVEKRPSGGLFSTETKRKER